MITGGWSRQGWQSSPDTPQRKKRVMYQNVSPQGGRRQGVTFPNYFACECGRMVDRETYFWMINDPDRRRCCDCNATYHRFTTVAAEDEPRTNEEYGEKVDRLDDLMVHAQGEDEGGES